MAPERLRRSTTSWSFLVSFRDTESGRGALAIPVLLILVVLWAAVLIPPMFRARTEGRGVDSIGDFRYRLGVIGKTGGHSFRRPAPLRTIAPPAVRALPGTPAPPIRSGGMTPAQRRRRDVLVTLLSAAGGTFVLGALSNVQLVWYLHVVADALVVAYVALLLRMKHAATERHAKVRYLPKHAAPHLTALRRTASS